MNVLVTGGAGFIGSNLVRRLQGGGDSVRILDDLSTGSAANLKDLAEEVELIEGDVRNVETVRRALDGVEIVYHLAAVPSVARSVEDPVTSHEVNVNGTFNVLDASRLGGVRRVVFASSAAVYGETPGLPRHEDLPAAPVSPYGANKLAGEAYCRSFSRVYGLEAVSLRFFNVFGPRQNPASEYASAVPRFVSGMMAGEAPTVFGDGLQSRDFVFVENIVEACTLAAGAGEDAVGQCINVGGGQRTTVLELIRSLNEILGTSLEPVFAPPRPGDVRDSEASIEKAQQLLGYRPLATTMEGLTEAVRWFREHPTATKK
jgi:UDP-glucose 4-epimerase